MTDEDQELYDSALGLDTPTEEAPPAEEPKAETAPERVRDEKGRFAKAEEPPAQEEPKPEPEKKEDHRIPLMELLNEREKRQAEQRKAETLMRELETLRQQLQQQQQPAPTPPPDQFQDPDGYNAYWEQRFQQLEQRHQQSIRQVMAENSLARAHEKYGDTFLKAYDAVLADPQTAYRVANSPNPGEDMVKWFQREETLKVVGSDPSAYAQKILDEALSNPDFLAKALEKAKGIAVQQPTQVNLPPSLNKVAAAARADDRGPMTDRGYYEHAIGR